MERYVKTPEQSLAERAALPITAFYLNDEGKWEEQEMHGIDFSEAVYREPDRWTLTRPNGVKVAEDAEPSFEDKLRSSIPKFLENADSGPPVVVSRTGRLR